MPYQNNNNRLSPDANGLTSITPIARNVNQQLQIRPDLAEASRFINTANALASLGQGITDVDRMLKREAQTNAIDQIILDKIEGNNKHDWKVAEKRLKGIHKWNPYTKNSYKSYSVQDIVTRELYNIKATPNLEKLSSEEYKQLTLNAQKNVMDYCKENNIAVGQAGASLEAFNKGIEQLNGEYLIKNNDYKFNLALAKKNEHFLTDGRNIAYNVSKDGQPKAYGDWINTYVQDLSESGVPNDEILSKYLPDMVKNMVVQLASDENNNLDTASLVNAVKQADLEGLNINSFNPNFDYDIRQTLKTAKLQRNLEIELDYKTQQLNEKINEDKARQEFWESFQNYTDMTPKEAISQINDVCKKYNVSSAFRDMLGEFHNVYITQTKLNDETDPDVLKQLQILAMTDDGQAIQDCLIENIDKVSDKHFRLYSNRANELQYRQEKAEALEERNNKKEAENQKRTDLRQFKTLLKIHEKRLNKNDTSNYLKRLNQIDPKMAQNYRDTVSDITNDVADGTITEQEGIVRLKELENYNNGVLTRYQRTKEMQNQPAPSNFTPILLANRDYVSRMAKPTSSYNAKAAQDAFTKMNMFRDNKEAYISSTYTDKRLHPIDKTYKPHNSYDLPKPKGTPIYMPKGLTGKVVSSGTEPTLGNYVIIQTDQTGDYFKMIHLNYAPSRGTICTQNTVIGRVGSTGKSTGPHLDISFYQSNGRNKLLADDFLNRSNEQKRNKK